MSNHQQPRDVAVPNNELHGENYPDVTVSDGRLSAETGVASDARTGDGGGATPVPALLPPAPCAHDGCQVPADRSATRGGRRLCPYHIRTGEAEAV